MEHSNATAIPYPWLMENVTQLSQSWQNGRFHHALLLQGVSGCGKAALTQLISKGMLCQNRNDLSHCNSCKSCLLFNAGNHPALVNLNPEGQTIGIDDIRLLGRFVQEKGQFGQYRVIVIHRLELLTLAAANALLKTLEEPNANVFIIMSCDNPSLLLPTIMSRCFKMTVAATDKAAAFQWLNQELSNSGDALSRDNFEQLYSLANRAPIQVYQWIKEDKINRLSLLTEQFAKWREGHLALAQFRHALAEDDFALLVFVQLMLKQLQTLLRDNLAQNNGSGDFSQSIEQLFLQLGQFNRDGHNIIGQNKALALIELLNQMDSQLKNLQG